MFSHDIKTSIDIESTPTQIWQVLTDFKAYAEWNPMLRNVRTRLEPAAEVRFEVLRGGARPLKLKAGITELRHSKVLAWRGGPGAIISGEHYFRIEQLDEQRCRFHHGEHFKGMLLPIFRRTLKNATSLYQAMNSALKQRVECLRKPATNGDADQ